jgi:hypothetical protein
MKAKLKQGKQKVILSMSKDDAEILWNLIGALSYDDIERVIKSGNYDGAASANNVQSINYALYEVLDGIFGDD